LSGAKRIRKNKYRRSGKSGWRKWLRRIRAGCIAAVAAAAMLVFSSALVLAYDLLIQHDFFKADRIDVAGNQRLTRSEVIQHAQLSYGTNILSVNLNTTRKRLLSHSLIAEARIKREFPSRIHLTIREHLPLAVLNLGRRFVINDRGEIFKEADGTYSEGLPVVNGLAFSDINVSGQASTPYFQSVMSVLTLGQTSKSVLPNRLIQRIDVDRESGLVLHTRGQIRFIRLGYSHFPVKYSRLQDVLRYLQSQSDYGKLEFIDLKNLNRIVINPLKGEPPARIQKEV